MMGGICAVTCMHRKFPEYLYEPPTSSGIEDDVSTLVRRQLKIRGFRLSEHIRICCYYAMHVEITDLGSQSRQ